MINGKVILTIFIGIIVLTHKTAYAIKNEYQLEQVITLVRHGVRPQTNLEALNHATGKEWPKWSVPDGHLTQHGYDGMFNQSQYQLKIWKEAGLPISLNKNNCSAQNQVFIWAAPDQRTRKTAEAISNSISKHCHPKVGMSSYKYDPLFDALKMGSARDKFDEIKQEFESRIVSQSAIQEKYAKSNQNLKETICAPNSCHFLDKSWELKLNKSGQPKLSGPAGEGANIGETIRLQYSENLPLSQVAFGQVKDANDVKKFMILHDAKYKYLNEIPLFAQYGGSILYQQILDALDNKTTTAALHRPLVVFVGHDTNISEIKTLLQFNWSIPQYLENDIPPGGTLSFEKYKEKSTGIYFVKIGFSARTLDQWRYLVPLSKAQPLHQNILKYSYCKTTSIGTLCPLNHFLEDAQKKIIHLNIDQPLYK